MSLAGDDSDALDVILGSAGMDLFGQSPLLSRTFFVRTKKVPKKSAAGRLVRPLVRRSQQGRLRSYNRRRRKPPMLSPLAARNPAPPPLAPNVASAAPPFGGGACNASAISACTTPAARFSLGEPQGGQTTTTRHGSRHGRRKWRQPKARRVSGDSNRRPLETPILKEAARRGTSTATSTACGRTVAGSWWNPPRGVALPDDPAGTARCRGHRAAGPNPLAENSRSEHNPSPANSRHAGRPGACVPPPPGNARGETWLASTSPRVGWP